MPAWIRSEHTPETHHLAGASGRQRRRPRSSAATANAKNIRRRRAPPRPTDKEHDRRQPGSRSEHTPETHHLAGASGRQRRRPRSSAATANAKNKSGGAARRPAQRIKSTIVPAWNLGASTRPRPITLPVRAAGSDGDPVARRPRPMPKINPAAPRAAPPTDKEHDRASLESRSEHTPETHHLAGASGRQRRRPRSSAATANAKNKSGGAARRPAQRIKSTIVPAWNCGASTRPRPITLPVRAAGSDGDPVARRPRPMPKINPAAPRAAPPNG